MPTPKMSFEKAREAVALVEQCVREGYSLEGLNSAYEEAARRLGGSSGQLRKRVKRAGELFGIYVNSYVVPPPEVNFPEFPDDDVPIEQVIELAAARFERVSKSFTSHTWFPITLSSDLPFGIAWFGDPHLDDNGCAWPILKRDVALCATTPGLWGVNVGDTTNNWAGRLMRLWMNQDTSQTTARRLARWFMLGSGVKWLLWLLGNHDLWSDGAAILQEMAKQHGTHRLMMHDWEARFRLVFPGGWEVLIYVAHNFKGTSIYNIMHGPMREGMMGEDADVYVCGDKHVSGSFCWENPARHRIQNFVRVRGYKFFDDHTRHLGFKEQSQGCAAVTIFDPRDKSIQTFLDLPKGVAFLNQLRSECASSS